MTVSGGWLMLCILIVGIIANFDPTGSVHHGDINMTDETRKVRTFIIVSLKISFDTILAQDNICRRTRTQEIRTHIMD